MENPQTPSTNGAEGAPSLTVRGQYIKDLSFENPNAPNSLMIAGQRPNIDVNVDLRAQKVQENFYEIQLHIVARAALAEGTLFLVDMVYAGLFEVLNIPDDRLEAILWIECPFVLFPFARRVVADVTRDGGFPPLMLDPIDFQTLYLQNKARAEQGGDASVQQGSQTVNP